jgi:hypothetical protein
LLIGGRAKTLRRASEDDSGQVSWHFELSLGLEYRPERREADPQLVPGAVDKQRQKNDRAKSFHLYDFYPR